MHDWKRQHATLTLMHASHIVCFYTKSLMPQGWPSAYFVLRMAYTISWYKVEDSVDLNVDITRSGMNTNPWIHVKWIRTYSCTIQYLLYGTTPFKHTSMPLNALDWVHKWPGFIGRTIFKSRVNTQPNDQDAG